MAGILIKFGHRDGHARREDEMETHREKTVTALDCGTCMLENAKD